MQIKLAIFGDQKIQYLNLILRFQVAFVISIKKI